MTGRQASWYVNNTPPLPALHVTALGDIAGCSKDRRTFSFHSALVPSSWRLYALFRPPPFLTRAFWPRVLPRRNAAVTARSLLGSAAMTSKWCAMSLRLYYVHYPSSPSERELQEGRNLFLSLLVCLFLYFCIPFLAYRNSKYFFILFYFFFFYICACARMCMCMRACVHMCVCFDLKLRCELQLILAYNHVWPGRG